MNIYIKHLWVVILLLLTTVACDDTFEEVNTNPNSVTELDAEYLFANSVLQTMRGGQNKYMSFQFGGQYSHFYVGRNIPLFMDRYFDYFESDEFKSLYESFYYGAIRTVEEVMNMTEVGGEQENEIRYTLAKVVSIMNYARVTDIYGAIPYTEGGIGQTGVLFPKYNTVEEIYVLMLGELKDAMGIIKNANSEMAFPGADPLYNNDLNSWARFVNSLRLRYAMRARFVLPENTVNDIIKECLSEDLILENNQNARNENQDSDVSEFSNPLYGHYTYWKWGLSELFIETMKAGADPRLLIYALPNKTNGEFVGIPNGLNDDELVKWDNWDGVSFPGDALVGKAATISFLTAAEMWFYKAEAALFGIIDEDANELYQTGIRKSFMQWGVSAEDIDTFFAESDVANLNGTTEQQFEQISTQLWLSLLSNEGEAWANIRRTGYPRLPVRVEPKFSLGSTGGVHPKRIKYPISEVNINNTNYLEAIAKQGPDELLTPLWWDIRD